MLLTKSVMVNWHPRNKVWYENKGYFYTKIGDEFEAKVEDLMDGSNAEVDVKCDCEECNSPILHIKWQVYKKFIKSTGEYYCQPCSLKLFGREKANKTKLRKSKSFYQWCYDNLSKELADWILSRWDYELNKISPKEVGFTSGGFNKKGYWFKCLDHPEHGSELKSINCFTSRQTGIECQQCNVIALTHPYLLGFFVNISDAYKYSMGSDKIVMLKCSCGYEKPMIINKFINHGFGCPRCSDGFKSYPEKFLFNVFEQLDKNFKLQLSKTTFDWCNDYRYDFYISENINCIVETHGLQHYEEIKSSNWGSLEDIQDNDFDKEWLARKNKIENYIVLDCRKSEMDWIKKEIINSNLTALLDFKESDIDWLKCHEFACNSNMVKEVCDLWNKGETNIIQISEKLKICGVTILKYLKQGMELGWCKYINHSKVICLNTEEIFDSQIEAGEQYHINSAGISACCKNKQKSAGKHLGKPLMWMYYDEYLIQNQTSEWHNDYLNSYDNINNSKVICLTTGEVFVSQVEASKKYNIKSKCNISACCKGKVKSCGTNMETGEKLVWAYYEESI